MSIADRVGAALPGPQIRGRVLLLAAGAFALGTDAFVISGVLPDVAGSLHTSLRAAGVLITVFAAVYAIAAPLLAVATGTLCRRRVLLASLFGFVVANVLAAVAPSFAVLVAARVLAALAAALYMPAAAATAAALAPDNERGRALAVVLTGLTVANTLGVPTGTLLGQAFGWRSTFVFVAAAAALTWLGIRLRLSRVPAPPVVALRERLATVRLPRVGSTLAVTTATVAGIFALYTYLAWFSDRVAGVDGAAVTLVYLVFGVFGMASTLSAGWLVDRHDPARVVAASIVGMAVAFGALALFAAAGLATGPAVVALLGVVAVWSLVGWWFNPAQQQRLLDIAGPRGTIGVSLNGSALYAGQALGGLVGGAALASGPAALALVAVGFELLALAVLALSSPILRFGMECHGQAVPE